MSRGAVWLVHLSIAAIAITGVVFFVMKYMMETDDPFAVANHPWQPHVLAAHVVAAPLAVFALGWLWNAHIRPKWVGGGKARRRSGLSGMWLLAPMILSGVLIQVATAEWFRTAMEWTHWISSGAFVVAYLV
ncbi:MAG: hypothetical protein ACRD2J_06825, partial [Thermoanaerobaculia bacterium]